MIRERAIETQNDWLLIELKVINLWIDLFFEKMEQKFWENNENKRIEKKETIYD